MAKKIEILENTLLKLLVRRGTDTDRRNISLSEGELGYTTDTERLFIGNGQPGGVVAGNRYLGSDSDPAATFTTALTGDLVFDTNTKSLCAFKGSGVWERVSSLTESTGDINVSVDAGDILSNACGRNMEIDGNGRIQTKATSKFNRVETINTDFLSIPRKLNLFDGTSNQSFTFPTNALGGKYLRTDASGNLSWEDPVGAAEFFYNSENGPIPVGAVLPFTAGGVIPTGYLVCNGQAVSRTTYSDLFDVIGVNYGSTTGSNFKVPDYSLSTLYGVDSDPHNAQVYKVGADVNLGGDKAYVSISGTGGATSIAQNSPGVYTYQISDLQGVGVDNSKIRGLYIRCKGRFSGTGSSTRIEATLPNDTNTLRPFYLTSETPSPPVNVSGHFWTETVKFLPINKNQTSFKLEIFGSAAEYEILGAEQFNSGGAGGTTITQEGFGSYSSGWVNSDGSTLVENRALLSLNHNLGSSELTFTVYVADDASGTNSIEVTGNTWRRDAESFGLQIQDITDTSYNIRLGRSGWLDFVSETNAAITDWAGKYIKVVAIAADAVISTPSTQSPLSAQGTIYVIKAIPDIVANPTLTVVSPLTATVNGVNKTNTAFSPLVGDIVIGQPDAAEAVPPGLRRFASSGSKTFTTKTQYTKFHVTGSGSTGGTITGSNAATLIGYLNLPVGTVLDLEIGAGIPATSGLTNGNYSQISHNGTVLVKSDGAIGGVMYNSPNAVNTGTFNKTYTFSGNQVVAQNSFIINGGAGVDTNGTDEESVGPASFWGSWPAPGAGAHGDENATIYTSDGMVMFEWVDTVSGGGTTQVTGGGSSLLKYGTIDAGNIGAVASNPPTVGDFTTTVVSNSIAGDTHDTTFECTFNTSLANNNYNVMFEIISNGPDINKDNNLKTPVVYNKTASGFRFNVEEGAVSNIGDNQINVRVESNEVGLGSIGGLKDPNHIGGTINVTTSFQDLDLSSIVGSNKAQVTMEIYGGSTNVATLFRTKGSVIERFVPGTSAGWGSSGVTPGPANQGGVVTLTTDSNGEVQYSGANTSTGVNYKVLTYQVIS